MLGNHDQLSPCGLMKIDRPMKIMPFHSTDLTQYSTLGIIEKICSNILKCPLSLNFRFLWADLLRSLNIAEEEPEVKSLLNDH